MPSNQDSKKDLPRGPKKKPMTPKICCIGVQKKAHDSKKVLPRGPKKKPMTLKNDQNFAYFPGVGPLLLSTRGGGIGMWQGAFAAI